MVTRKHIVILISMLGILAAVDVAAAPESPAHVEISAQFSPNQYIGIPTPITISIKNNWSFDEAKSAGNTDTSHLDRGSFKDLPEAKKGELRGLQYLLRTKITFFPSEILDLNPSYQILLTHADNSGGDVLASTFDSKAIEWADSPDVFENPKRNSTISINAGEVRETLGSFINIPGLTEGNYQLSLKVAGVGENGRFLSVPITVKKLPDSASDVLRGAFSKENEAVPENAVGWISKNWDGDYALSSLPPDIVDNIVLFAFLNKAAVAGKIDAAPINILERFPSYLSGLALTLRFEVALSKGDQIEITRLRHDVEEKHPGLIWRLEAAEKGEGLIAKSILLRHVRPHLDSAESLIGRKSENAGVSSANTVMHPNPSDTPKEGILKNIPASPKEAEFSHSNSERNVLIGMIGLVLLTLVIWRIKRK